MVLCLSGIINTVLILAIFRKPLKLCYADYHFPKCHADDA
jgi:hypothetical protein